MRILRHPTCASKSPGRFLQDRPPTNQGREEPVTTSLHNDVFHFLNRVFCAKLDVVVIWRSEVWESFVQKSSLIQVVPPELVFWQLDSLCLQKFYPAAERLVLLEITSRGARKVLPLRDRGYLRGVLIPVRKSWWTV